MASSNNKQLISIAKPHTIKKFELIESYIETWVQKLLNNPKCKRIVFIDCMCNSGVYQTTEGETVYGTPVRVARILRDAAGQYPSKQIYIYLNDNDSEKIELLKLQLPKECNNFHYSFTAIDANERLKQIGPKLHTAKNLNFFLLYDPYDAAIDWLALAPFFRNWGEVLINHMVSDSVRAIKQAKSQKAIEKYEGTYLADFEDLLPCGSDKTAYEKRLEQIITKLKGSVGRQYYIAAFPFFNSRNAYVTKQNYISIHWHALLFLIMIAYRKMKVYFREINLVMNATKSCVFRPLICTQPVCIDVQKYKQHPYH